MPAKVSDEEMRHVFNVGIGMIIVSSKKDVDFLLDELKAEKLVVMGEVE